MVCIRGLPPSFSATLVAPLLEGAWALHHNLRLVDALYELAKQLDATIITTDPGDGVRSSYR